jgi:ribose transport system ATP-binding protein
MSEYALNMRKIFKAYGGVPVLKEVDFSVKTGEVHALVGENGAGKTTLMNILGGVAQLDGGEVEVLGERLHSLSPGIMQEKGVAFIHQELNVVNDLTVYENLFLGRELRTKIGTLDVKAMCREANRIFSLMQVSVDPKALVGSLEMSTKQIVEIARSLLLNAKIIIMDEPTTSLTQTEIDQVFRLMTNLARQHGVSIIFISHKLGEVVQFCDSYTVLRNGEKVAEGPLRKADGTLVNQSDIARMMVGQDVLSVEVYVDRVPGEIVLEVDGLSINGHVHDVSFILRKCEVLGITGLLGDGKEHLVRSLFGDLPIDAGRISLNGQHCQPRHPAQGKAAGIGFLPTNRKENAIIKDLSIQSNITIVSLKQCTKGPVISKRMERGMAEKAKLDFSIKIADFDNPITSLSGGNQQKAVLSKWLGMSPALLLLSNPTQGVDVGAKNEIYNQIMKLAEQGVGIIITSGEAREIMKICDRVLVMYHGSVRGMLDRAEMTEENIMILSTGGEIGNVDRSMAVCNPSN